MAEEKRPVGMAEIERAMHEAWDRQSAALPRLAASLDAEPVGDAWSPRELLSHLIGAWQRVPMHTAFVLAGAPVPIRVADPCWTPEYATAPIGVFEACLRAGYDANAAFLKRLEAADLSAAGETPFGAMQLGELLLLSYARHMVDFHMPQIEALAA